MSDFLSNLITRSHAEQSAIQPRLLSRFESTSAESFGEVPASVPATTAAQTPSPEISPSPEIIANTLANEQAGTEKLNADAKGNLTAEKFSSQMDEPEQPLSSRSNEKYSVDFEKNKTVIPVASALAGKNSNSAAKSPLFQEASAHTASQGRRQNAFSPVESRPSVPAIHVTIGRVEVRAIHSAAPAPKPAKAAPPKLSLEDYLQKRHGGVR